MISIGTSLDTAETTESTVLFMHWIPPVVIAEFLAWMPSMMRTLRSMPSASPFSLTIYQAA